MGLPFLFYGRQTGNRGYMKNEEYRKLLEKRERDLLEEMDKHQTEAREMTDQSATEPMERIVNLEGRDTLLSHNDADYQELTEVQGALERLANGTFGKCIDCGKEIPAARLAAVPWTERCLEDQEKHDQCGPQVSGSLTL
jgi:DnaK suppressor protein